MRKTFLFIFALCATIMAWGTTVTKTATQLATMYSWQSTSNPFHVYQTFALDENVTVIANSSTPCETSTGSTNGIFSGDKWYVYQVDNNGSFTISAAAGYIIKTIKITYSPQNQGTLSFKSGFGIAEADQIASGSSVTVDKQSATLYVGCKEASSTSTNINARITQFSVTYEKGIVETFERNSGGASAADRVGAYYTWTITTGVRTKTTDILFNKTPSIWLAKEGAMETTTAIEGGVKYVSFLWNKFDKNASSITVNVTAGGVTRTLTKEVQTGADYNQNHPDLVFGDNFGVKSNTTLKIANPQNTTALQIGPITIVPYLRYTYTETQEVNISAGTFDCSAQINNTDGEGSITYSSDNACVSFADASIPTATLNGGGEATITATWSEGASTSFKLKVIPKSTPEISFENEAIAITDLYSTDPVANELTVTEGAGEVTYETSNPLVAKIVENQVMVVGVGTATITATAAENEDYLSASATYALTVNEPTGETAVDIAFGTGLINTESGDKKYIKDEAEVTSTNGLYDWLVNCYRYNGTWVRLANTENPYLKFDGNQEGGIKRLVFNWFRAGGTPTPAINTKITIVDGATQLAERSIVFDANDAHGSLQPYNVKMEVKQNAQLIINNFGSPAVMHFQDISIVPYVLYTQKAQTADAVDGTYDATTGLINNAPAGEVTYSIVTEDAQATIEEATGVIDMSNVTTSEDIVIKASYEDAYTTMNLHVNALPIPVVTFPNLTDNKKTVDMNQAPFTESISVKVDDEEVSEPTITYESSDEAVAKVDEDGEVTVIGAGTAMITATIDQTTTYKGTAASYELTITDPKDDAITETFERIDAGSSPADRKGKYYTWTITTGARTKDNDKLFNETPSIWLSGNGDASMETTVEGGVKRVGFLWNKFNKTANPISVSVIAGGVERTLEKEVQTGDDYNQNHPDLVFNSNFGIKSNTKLKIANPQNTTALQIGPIAITPYLLYTKKYDEVKLNNGTYVNTDLINNTKSDGTITFSAEPNGYVEFQENPTYPGTFELLKAGEVTITATWTPSNAADGEIVTTSYVLKINDKEYMDAHFATAGNFEKELGNTFTNAVTYTKGEGTVNYSSDDTNVAEVDDAGKVTIKGIGTTTIKAHLDATEDYFAWDGSYKVIARTGGADGNKLVEHFVGLPTGLAPNEEYECEIAKWKANQIRRGTNDTIGGSGVQGNNIHSTGSIYNTTEIEGGIKYFSFNWKQWANESVCTLKLHVKLGDSDYSMEKAGTELATYEHYFFAINAGIKSNVDIALYNESYNTDGPLTSDKGRITFDAFEIVPYLFYKTKYHKMDVANGDAATWTNTDLIDNTEGGTVEYSIEDVEGEGVAEINATNGQVTAKSNGKAKVTATWTPTGALEGEVVTTTYELEVFYSKLDAELSFDPEEITVGVNETTITTPTLINPHELTVKYSSSDETIATVDENSGAVTLKGVAGDVIISAKSEETDTYKAGSASYTIHVLLLTSEVTFPNLTDNEKTVNIDADPFTENISVKVNDEEVPESTITYESSNENAAQVDETTGEVTIIGVGETTITAKVAAGTTYPASEASYTLTVEAPLITEDNSWTETFSQIDEHTSWQKSSSVTNQKGDGGVFTWQFLNYRTYTNSDWKIGLRSGWANPTKKNDYVAQQTVSEGGIKYISMIWVPNSNEPKNPNPIYFTMGDMTSGSILHTYKADANTLSTSEPITTTMRYDVKKNAQLRVQIKNSETEQEQYNSIKIKSITVVPYLLYTKKEVSVTYDLEGTNEVDVTENLINNLEEGETVTYSLSDGVEATIDGSTITLANATEDVIVTATWGEVSTTFTLKVTKTEEPVVVPDYVLENKTAGAYATICLPNKIDHVENATLYSISHGNTSAIEFVEASYTTDKAGMPYLVQVENDGDVNFFYGDGDAVDAPVSAEEAKGFVGKLAEDNPSEPTYVPSNGTAILVSGGQLHMAGEWCVLTQNHAYISTTYLPQTATPSSAPRKTIRLYNPEAQAPTGNPSLHHSINSSFKMIKEGHLYIIRDTKMYNAQGILVE